MSTVFMSKIPSSPVKVSFEDMDTKSTISAFGSMEATDSDISTVEDQAYRIPLFSSLSSNVVTSSSND